MKWIITLAIVATVAATADLPGLDYLGKGYDITKYDNTKKMTGSTIMEMSYDNNYAWINPFTNVEYKVVDQIPGPESIKIYGGSVSVQETITYTKKNDLDTLNHDTDLFRYISNEVYSGRLVSVSKSVLSSYTLVLVPPEMIQITDVFKQLANFPIYNKTTKNDYYNLIKKVGTHYISELSGGSVYYQIASSPLNLSIRRLDRDYYSTAAGFNLLNRIDRDSEVAGNRPVNSSWLKYSTVTTYCLGGSNVCPNSAASKKQWILNSFSDPFVAGYVMTEISRLLPIRYQDQYKNAVQDYIRGAYLNSIGMFYKFITNPSITNLLGTKNLITYMDYISIRGNISAADWVFRDSCTNACCNRLKQFPIINCSGLCPHQSTGYYDKYMAFRKRIMEPNYNEYDYSINLNIVLGLTYSLIDIFDLSESSYWQSVGYSIAAYKNITGYCYFEGSDKCEVDAIAKATSTHDGWYKFVPDVWISSFIRIFY